MDYTTTRITWTRPIEVIAEVRDPDTNELVEHMWAPDTETIDLSAYVRTFEMRLEDERRV